MERKLPRRAKQQKNEQIIQPQHPLLNTIPLVREELSGIERRTGKVTNRNTVLNRPIFVEGYSGTLRRYLVDVHKAGKSIHRLHVDLDLSVHWIKDAIPPEDRLSRSEAAKAGWQGDRRSQRLEKTQSVQANKKRRKKMKQFFAKKANKERIDDIIRKRKETLRKAREKKFGGPVEERIIAMAKTMSDEEIATATGYSVGQVKTYRLAQGEKRPPYKGLKKPSQEEKTQAQILSAQGYLDILQDINVDVIRHKFLTDTTLSNSDLAKKWHVTSQQINNIVRTERKRMAELTKIKIEPPDEASTPEQEFTLGTTTQEYGFKNLRTKRAQVSLITPNALPSVKQVLRAFTSKEEWQLFCQKYEVFELFTNEYIESFSSYLTQRVKMLGATEKQPLTILEVGAGNGKLSHLLQTSLNAVVPDLVKIIAVDSGAWDIHPDFPVEKREQKEALALYQPDIVISSWMPPNVDFTIDFRNTASVKEYVLIGLDTVCGKDWETWGYPLTLTPDGTDINEEETTRKSLLPPPFQADGFERRDLPEVSKYQISMHDNLPLHSIHLSKTVSFTRQ